MNRISALIRDPESSPVLFLLSEGTERRQLSQPRRGLSSDSYHAGTLVSDFQPPEL